MNYNILLKKKQQLLIELELSKIQSKSNELEAKTDLIKKLSKSISENKKMLKYQEEDYLNIKNKRDQITKTIENLKLKVKELNKHKKECFSEINRITRKMDENNEKDLVPLDKNNLSNAEKIKLLQKEARDFQFQIKNIEQKINKSQLKFKEINPRYEKLENDYRSLLKIIKSDEEALNQIQKELEDEYVDKEEYSFEDLDLREMDYIKSSQEIENEIQNINNDLSIISKFNSFVDTKNPKNFKEIEKKLKEIENTLKNKKNIQINSDNDEINDSINNFRKLELLNQKLEALLNKFLIEINLETNFQIIISNNYTNFSVKTKFIRSNKEILTFEELTTPEKIFFVIIFYLSIQILLNFENIIFSNLFLPNIYNKRGSVFRTIRKVIPIFKKEDELKKANLIFIISQLELKKPIENIKVLKIE